MLNHMCNVYCVLFALQVGTELIRQAVEGNANYDTLMIPKPEADTLTDKQLLAFPFEKLYRSVRGGGGRAR